MIDKAISKWGLLCLQWESVHLWYMIDKRAFKYHITHFQAFQEPSPYLTQLSLLCHPLPLIITIYHSRCVTFWHIYKFCYISSVFKCDITYHAIPPYITQLSISEPPSLSMSDRIYERSLEPSSKVFYVRYSWSRATGLWKLILWLIWLY